MQQRAQRHDTGASHHRVSPHETERGSRGEEQRGDSTKESFVPTGTHKQSRRLTTRHEQGRRHPKACIDPDRAPARADVPRRHRPRRDIDPPTRLDRPDPPRDRQTYRERPYFADGRLRGPLVADAEPNLSCAAEDDGGRDGRRPSRPPHGCAGRSSGGQRPSGRERSQSVHEGSVLSLVSLMEVHQSAGAFGKM